MVELLRGVTAGGGTAAGASAAGHPVAGKTGTVNDHTDVWFIGFTPTYATGVWMGNPEKKENLGGGMTGGHGALPYFNRFMNVFMKGKPVEKFEQPPPIPSDIKALIARNKREELEKLEEAEIAGRKTGVSFSTGNAKPAPLPGVDTGGGDVTDPALPVDAKPDVPKPPDTRPEFKPVIIQPPVRKPDNDPPPDDKPEGTKRKGKKGDG